MFEKIRNLPLTLRFIRALCISYLAKYVEFETAVKIVRYLSGGVLYPHGWQDHGISGPAGIHISFFLKRVASSILPKTAKEMLFDEKIVDILNLHINITEYHREPTIPEVYQWQWMVNSIYENPVIEAANLLFFIGYISEEDRNLIFSAADIKLHSEKSFYLGIMERAGVDQATVKEVEQYFDKLGVDDAEIKEQEKDKKESVS